MMGPAILLLFVYLHPAAVTGTEGGEDARMQEASRAYAAGETERALLLYEEVLLENPSHPQALQAAGLILYHAMEYADAEKHFRTLSEHCEGMYPLLMLGNCALQQYQPFEAKQYYLKALELEPDNETLKQNLALAEDRILRAGKLSRHYRRVSFIFRLAAAFGVVVLLCMVAMEIRSARK